MKLLDAISPLRLAAIAGAGSCIAIIGVASAMVRLQQHYRPGALFWIFAIGGSALAWTFEERVTSGISAQRWSDAELAPLRQRMDRLFPTLALVPFVVLAVTAFGPRGATPLFPMSMFALLSPMRIAGALRISQTEPPRVDWSGSAPLQSEHWGAPATHARS